MTPTKARLAPTPSGFLHRGNAANFLLNTRLAAGGELLLRIDDLDRGRFRPVYLRDVFRLIDQLGITVTEGPTDPHDFQANWSQENRLPLYREALSVLRNHELVFACPCTRKELAGGTHRHGCPGRRPDPDAPGTAWRVDTRSLPPVRIPDRVVPEGFTVSPHDVIPDFVIRNRAGRPSYQLACTVDDVHFSVTTVGRGRDLLPSTAAQAIVSGMLGYPPLFERLDFLHHPLIGEPDGSKLSKSAGAQGEAMELSAKEIRTLSTLVDGWLASGPPDRP